MASTQQIKQRIGSVKNTRQITKAMQLVAASKMRRAQDATQRSRLFAQTAQELLTRLGQLVDLSHHELYHKRPVSARLIIVVASDRGLAGAYDSNVLRKYIAELTRDDREKVKNYTITIGRKASQAAARLRDAEVVGAYHNFPDQPDANDVRPILNTAIELFTNRTVDAVDIIYTHFYSSVNQAATLQRLLPAGFTETEVPQDLRLATFEPSAGVVLRGATLRLVEAQLWQALLEAVASEYSMRMLAMKSATDNANELVDDLTLAFNNARQAAITQELAEITGGAEALNG